MSTRAERDQARIRCLVAIINSLHCELGRIVNAGEDPDRLEDYAHANLAKGETEESLVGLDIHDLVKLMGSIAAMEKLVAMGNSAESVHALFEEAPHDVDPQMWSDLLLYLEGVDKDRPAEASAEA